MSIAANHRNAPNLPPHNRNSHASSSFSKNRPSALNQRQIIDEEIERIKATKSSDEARETEICIKGYDFMVSQTLSNPLLFLSQTAQVKIRRHWHDPQLVFWPHLCLYIESFDIQPVHTAEPLSRLSLLQHFNLPLQQHVQEGSNEIATSWHDAQNRSWSLH